MILLSFMNKENIYKTITLKAKHLFPLIHMRTCILSSPCDDIRREANQERANECADLLGGPLPPLLLLLQAFLANTVKAHSPEA